MVHELDVIGSTTQTIPRRLPSGLRLIGSQRVDTFELHRFALTHHARQSSPDALDTLAGTLLGYPDPVASVGAVLIQHGSH
jgi:hypothetical protein